MSAFRVFVELADTWDVMAQDAKPAARREALRECADGLRMMADFKRDQAAQGPTIWEDPAGKGYPCFERPMTPAECKEAIDRYSGHLLNLLARIHRDGGQYVGAHGLPKAVADADALIARLFAERDEKAVTHGLSAETLLGRAVKEARRRFGRSNELHPRWVAVMSLLAVGRTAAHEICQHFGFDPDEQVKRRA